MFSAMRAMVKVLPVKIIGGSPTSRNSYLEEPHDQPGGSAVYRSFAPTSKAPRAT